MFDLQVPWWELVVRSVIVFVTLHVLLRITGKRQIGQMSPFDLILLLILSNAVQNSMTAGDNSLLGGLISAVTLIGLNYFLGFLAFKSPAFEKAIEGEPRILISKGQLYQKVLDDEQISAAELQEILRSQNCTSINEVDLAILETNGKVSVLRKNPET
ncbi:MAG: DUF421 domain-containing protein [Bdellovibrio sp.]|jgi:uncharacterized membrane protein YcaP (DUF421 family)